MVVTRAKVVAEITQIVIREEESGERKKVLIVSDFEPLLFTLDHNRDLSEGVASGLGVPTAKHQEQYFEDGEHKFRAIDNVRNRDIYVLDSLYEDEEASTNDKLCELLFFIGSLKEAKARSVTAVTPYLCYSRKDRITKPQDPVTTKYLAQLFESVGTDHLVAMDVHNIAAFQNAFRIPTDHLEADELFLQEIESRCPEAPDITVLSPDIGGFKRAKIFQQRLQQRFKSSIGIGFMEKQRSSDVVSGTQLVGEIRNKTVVIIDDLISTGTTLMRAAEACRDKGAHKVWAFATHGLFIGNAGDKIADDELDQVFVTNTIRPFRLQHSAKVGVLDAGVFIGQKLRTLFNGSYLEQL